MERASKYLKPYKHATKKTRKPDPDTIKKERDKTTLTLAKLINDGLNTERPETRADCPDFRPCPFVSCRYHMAIDVRHTGSIIHNFDNIEEHMLRPSCALDVAEKGEHTTREIGEYMNLTGERIRQIERQALNKIAEKQKQLNGEIDE